MFLLKSSKKRSSSTLSDDQSSEEDEPWMVHAQKQGKPGAKGQKMKQLKKKVHTRARKHLRTLTHTHTPARRPESRRP
jgi:murein L,D-transpeptidase YcbB/YkuD